MNQRPKSPAVIAFLMSVVGVVAFTVATRPSEAATASSAEAAGTYVPIAATRVLDTRASLGARPARPRSVIRVQISDRGGLPVAGVATVALTVTVTQPASSGYLVVYGDGSAQPATSNINFQAGHTVSNSVLAKVGTDGKVAFFNASSGSTQVIADISGYYPTGTVTAPGAFVATQPTRLLDTRSSSGAAAPPAHSAAVVQVIGRGPVPPTGVAAIALTVTAAAATSTGYVTVYPDAAAKPATSNVNFRAGQAVANLIVTPVGPDGKIDLYNASAGSVQLIADVAGYFLSGSPTAAGTFVPVTSTRVVDTRSSLGAATPGPHQRVAVHLPTGAVPAGVSAVVLNVTAVAASAAGYLTVFTAGNRVAPTASNLNFAAGQTVPNLVTVAVGADGRIAVYNGSPGATQFLIDTVGYYLAGTRSVWSWGHNYAGQLGNGADINTAYTVAAHVSGLGDVTHIAGGGFGAYALTSDGRVWAWGSNDGGQLGNNYLYDATVPIQVLGLPPVTAVAGGFHDGYALAADGHVWAWGYNPSGELGDGTADSENHPPVQVTGLSNVTAIASAYSTAFALTADGTVWSWGSGANGALGDGTTASSAVPVRVSGLTTVTAVAGGSGNGYALTADGRLWSWGYGGYGELGTGSTADSLIPAQVSGLPSVASIAASSDASAYAVTSDGHLWAWGYNAYGQLGNGTTTHADLPGEIDGLSNVVSVAAAETTGYALTTDGLVWAFGADLGNGTPGRSYVPVQVTGLTNITAIAGAGSAGYALTS